MPEKISSAESGHTPKSVLEYLDNKHSTIINNYHTPDGRHSEACTAIAVEIARLLLKAGRKPYLVKISEDVRKGGILSYKELAPLVYKNQIVWSAHVVCCCDGQVFDPILGAPMAIEGYTTAVFGEDVKMKVLISPDKMEEFANR